MSKSYVNPPDGVNALNPVPNVDSRKQVIYDNSAAALSALPANRRAEGLYLLVRDGGKIKRYHFDGGTADEHFVLDPAYEGGGESNIMENDGSGHVRPKFDKKIKAAVIDGLATGDHSIETAAGKHTLKGDEAIPAASKYYGTDSQGQRGYHPLPAPEAGGGEVEEAPADNEKYVRQDAKWVPLPVKEAPENGSGYLRTNGGWSVPEIADVNGLAQQLSTILEIAEPIQGFRERTLVYEQSVNNSARNIARHEIRIPWEDHGHMVLDITLMISTNSVASKAFVTERYFLSKWSSGAAGELYNNEHHTLTNLFGPTNSRRYVFMPAEEDTANGEIIIPVLSTDDRQINITLRAAGRNAVINQIFQATFAASVSTETEPLPAQYPEQPSPVSYKHYIDGAYDDAVISVKALKNILSQSSEEEELPEDVFWVTEPLYKLDTASNGDISYLISNNAELSIDGTTVSLPNAIQTLTISAVQTEGNQKFVRLYVDYSTPASPTYETIEGSEDSNPVIPNLPADSVGIATQLITKEGVPLDIDGIRAEITHLQKTKVNKDGNKVLSDQNYTIAEKNKVERVPSDTQVALDEKVQAVAGKGLSDENYTTIDKGKVEKLPNDTQTQLAEKVDKVIGKGLSTHDYIAADKNKVNSLPSDPGTVLNSKAPKDSPVFTGSPSVDSQRAVDALHGSAVLTYSEISKLIGNAIQEYGDDIELPSGVNWNVEPRVQQGKIANEVNVISSVLGNSIELDVNGSIVQFPETTLTFSPVEDTNALMKRFDIIVADYTDTANPFFQIIEGTKSTEPSIPAPSGNQILINTRLITTQGASVNLEDLTQLIQDFQTQIDDTYEEFRPVPSLVQEKLQDNSNWDANNNWKSTGDGGELLEQFPGAGAGLADVNNPYPPGTTEENKNYTNNYFIEAGSRVYPSSDNYYYIFTQNNIPIRMLKTTLRFTAQEITNIGNSSWTGGTPTVMPDIEPIIGKEYTNGSYLYKVVPDTTGNPSLIRIPLG